MKYRKKPIVIEASRWFKNGDHPQDKCVPVADSSGLFFPSEGKIVRYYRTPKMDGGILCQKCNSAIMHFHGWVDTPEGGHIVCPGDWIVTGIKGEFYPVKPDIFEATYERVEECEKIAGE